MKKGMFVCLLLLVPLCISSCDGLLFQDEIEQDMNEIYAMDDAFIGTEAEKADMNLISTKDVASIDANAQPKKQIMIGRLEHEIFYSETYTDSLDGSIYDKYWIDKEKGYFVHLNRDGTIKFLRFPFAVLEISDLDSPQQVLSKLEPELNEIVNVSKYKYVDVPTISEHPDGFGVYTFMFYNMANEVYITDFCRVTVQDSGEVSAYVNNDLSLDVPDFSIDKELERQFIELKLKQLYSVSGAEYKSAGEIVSYQIVVYNSQLYAQYSVSAIYVDSEGVEMTSYLNRILIPISLLELK